MNRHHFRSFCLWFVGGCVLLQLALGSAIDRALPEVRDPEYVHREALLAEQVTDARPLVMVLGSSRVQNGVDAKTATETLDDAATVFNFGIPTSGPFLERVWLERLFARGIKPDYLLLEVMPMHYNAHHPAVDLRGLDGARLAADEVAKMPASVTSLSGPARRWLVGRVLPAYRHQAEIRARFDIDRSAPDLFGHPDLKAIDDLGWQARTVTPQQGETLRRLAHVQWDGCYRDFELNDRQRAQLEDTLRLCREHGIAVALLLTPEGSEFRNLASAKMEAEVGTMLAELSEKYHAPIIDARAWMADERFFDMHHLDPEGAGEFSRRLAREGIAAILRDNRLAACPSGTPATPTASPLNAPFGTIPPSAR